MTNTVSTNLITYDKISYVSVAKILAEVISLIHKKKSLHDMRDEHSYIKYATFPEISLKSFLSK